MNKTSLPKSWTAMLLEKYVALSAAAAWFSSQVLKTLVRLMRRNGCSWRGALFGTGDMPSSHSAFVSALCGSIYLGSGLSLPFVLALALALLTVRDAVGVRQEVGIHAGLLNQLMAAENFARAPLSIKAGHTPLDVGFGVGVGLVAALAVAAGTAVSAVLRQRDRGDRSDPVARAMRGNGMSANPPANHASVAARALVLRRLARLNKRVNLLPVHALGLALIAFQLASPQPLRIMTCTDTTATPAASSDTRPFFALVNVVIALTLCGAVVFISTNLSEIPVPGFIALFIALSVLMLTASRISLRAEATGWARTWSFWGGIFVGIALISSAHRFGLLSFIPDLILVWTGALILIGLWVQHPLMLAMAETFLLGWLATSFLYGQSQWPGLVLAALLSWHLLARQAPSIVFGLHLLVGVLLANMYAYAALSTSRDPLHFPMQLVAVNFGLFALLWVIGHGVAMRARWPAYAATLRGVAISFGLAALLALCFDPAWRALRKFAIDSAGNGLGGLGLAASFWAVSAALLRHAHAGPRRWLGAVVCITLGTFGALAIAEPEGVLAQHLPAGARSVALALGAYALYGGARVPRIHRVALGGVLLAGALAAMVAAHSGRYTWTIVALWTLATLLGLATWRGQKAIPL